MIQLDAGDIIKMKKKHPCGSDEWQIVKTGADIKKRKPVKNCRKRWRVQ